MKKKQSIVQVIPGAITNEDTPKIKQILDNLSRDHNCQIFLEPVDYKGLGLTDYLTIVKTPMDISTVTSKLIHYKYSSVQEVINDIMLIWKNCKNYNIEGSEIHNIAIYMEKLAKKEIEKFYKVKFPKQEKFTFIKDYEEEDFLPPHLGDNEISIEDKISLSESIRKLNTDGLASIIEVLRSKCSKALREVEKDKLKVAMDNIDKETFIKIQEILTENFQKEKEKKISKKLIQSVVKEENTAVSEIKVKDEVKDKDKDKDKDIANSHISNASNIDASSEVVSQ